MENSHKNDSGILKFKIIYPTNELKRFIKHYFFCEFRNDLICYHPFKLNVVSNGEVELYIHFDESYLTIIHGNNSADLSCFIKGVFKLDQMVFVMPRANKRGICKGVSLPLTIAGLEGFREVTGCDLVNKLFDVSAFLDFNFPFIHEQCKDLNFDAIAKILDASFLSFFKKQIRFKMHPLDSILEITSSSDTPLNVKSIANKCNSSYRTLNRNFYRTFGLSPKTYLKILRFNKACKYLQRSGKINWMDLVYSCGYYDQSHFIHEFHELIKMCPTEYYKCFGKMLYINHAVLLE
jgi:AraC-like DNA-binding protein